MEKLVEQMKSIYAKYEGELKNLNRYIYENPELGREEYKASEAHRNLLEKYGFEIENKLIGIDTAFMAKYSSGKPGPKVAFLAEYDALPGIGHGCGHNILGVTSSGAALVLKEFIDETGGEVFMVGTPAEETCGAKVDMAKAGIFDDMDAAIIAHPTGKNHYRSGTSQAMEALQFTFRGKTAHAAGQPHEGINALDAVLMLFNSINALRQQVKDGARIHGIISEGGKAANIIPDLAVAQFYVRASTLKYLNELVEKVKKCAQGAALATGTTLEIENYEYSFADLVTNETLSEAYLKNLKLLGVEEVLTKEGKGSTDAGDVSHCCPTIHPSFPISKSELVGHSVEFAQATITEEAHEGMKKAALAMALTGLDVLKNKEFLEAVKKEFQK